MAKAKKQYKLHSVKLDINITKILEDFCEKNFTTKTDVIEKGIMLYINSRNAISEKMSKLNDYEKRMQELLEKAEAAMVEDQFDKNNQNRADDK